MGPTMVNVDNKGIIVGLWRGELQCFGPKAKDADSWILICDQEGMLVEVEHAKAHRSREGEAANVTL